MQKSRAVICILMAQLLLVSAPNSEKSSSTVVAANQTSLTSVYGIYSNVDIVSTEYTAIYVRFSVTGFKKQEAWLVLNSPLKPLVVTSNDTLAPFLELSYNTAENENPLENTTEPFAWSYDSINSIVYLKLLLTSANSPVNVAVTLYYLVSVHFSEFKLDKTDYSLTEPINVEATISANYTFSLTFHWLVEILILTQPSGALYQKGSEEFDLAANQTKTVNYQFVALTEPGNYTSVARAVDPRNNNVVVASSEIPFKVYQSGNPPSGEFPIPPWVAYVLVSIIAIVLGLLFYRRFKDRIHFRRQGTKR